MVDQKKKDPRIPLLHDVREQIDRLFERKAVFSLVKKAAESPATLKKLQEYEVAEGAVRNEASLIGRRYGALLIDHDYRTVHLSDLGDGLKLNEFQLTILGADGKIVTLTPAEDDKNQSARRYREVIEKSAKAKMVFMEQLQALEEKADIELVEKAMEKLQDLEQRDALKEYHQKAEQGSGLSPMDRALAAFHESEQGSASSNGLAVHKAPPPRLARRRR